MMGIKLVWHKVCADPVRIMLSEQTEMVSALKGLSAL